MVKLRCLEEKLKGESFSGKVKVLPTLSFKHWNLGGLYHEDCLSHQRHVFKEEVRTTFLKNKNNTQKVWGVV